MLNKLILKAKSKLEEAKDNLSKSPNELIHKKHVLYWSNELVRLVGMKQLSSLNRKKRSQE
jgi:hypothetical protein